jgi:hypothetical protein
MKLLFLRGFGVERILPIAFEVDGVGEHKSRRFVESALADQVLDFVIGLFFDPRVDGRAHALGRNHEIDAVKAGAVIGLHKLEVALFETRVLLRPQCVGHMQFVALVLGVHCGEQRAHRRVQPIWRQREVENMLHLRRCLAARAGIRHSKCGRDALRRKEKIARLLRKLRVEIDGEGVAAVHGFGLIGWGR